MTQHPAASITLVSTLSRQITPLVGRTNELAQIRQQLLDPACRLLTLLGPGGMGKTRLAIEMATSLQDEFAAGVHFVNLQPLSDPTQLPSALADALHFPLSGSDSVEIQLFRYLANKELLLLLDNFEHLLTGADFLSELLLQSPGVKALITSREVLNLQEEWLFPLAGLAFPPVGFDPESLEQYAAVTLFVERVRHLRPQFVLAEEAETVAHICRLVEGMPLALELAASWTKTITCAEIATEIERGIEFLTTSLRNIPERHRSMLAVFEQSWQQLSAEEQSVFARLSIFRGGFRLKAAEQVADASLVLLSGLVDKSLLWREREETGYGRYQIHELLRQFSAEQLAHSAEAVQQMQARHSFYYLQLLAQLQSDLLNGRQLEASLTIEADFDNVRLAWQLACHPPNVEALQAAAQSLYLYCALRSHLSEGVALFQQATQSLASEPESSAQQQALLAILPGLAWLLLTYGRLPEARRAALDCQQIYEQSGDSPVWGHGTDPRLILAELALVDGDYATAHSLAQDAFRTNQRHNHSVNCAIATYVLAFAAFAHGDFTQAQQYGQQSLFLAQQSQNRVLQVDILQLLGDIHLTSNNLPAARSDLERAYQLVQELAMPGALAATLNRLGEVVLQQGAWAEAEQHYHASLAINERIHNQGEAAFSWLGLGNLALQRGDAALAWQQFQHALQLAARLSFVPALFWVLLRFGQWYCTFGQLEVGARLLRWITNQEACPAKVKEQARQALLSGKAMPDSLKMIVETALPLTLEGLVADLLLRASLSDQETVKSEATRLIASPSTITHQPLIEPLTERELEILHLIAEGHTNLAIADKLILSPGTVKWYSSEIYSKLGVANRTQAVAEARRLKLLTYTEL